MRFFRWVAEPCARRYCRGLCIIVSAIACATPALVSGQTPSVSARVFPWPISQTPVATSSFGEPRSGRFHFGIDFSTGGVTGKPVRSIGNGRIVRITTSPFGYGKGLYVNLDSGLTVVYGHLSALSPAIEDTLDALRNSKGSYDLDFHPGNHPLFRVEEGELIAWSGDSGSGAPHLHVEIRDSGNIPVNPLALFPKMPDATPPRIDAVTIIPLDNRSTVDGIPDSRWLSFAAMPQEPLYLSGSIGISASVLDTISDPSYRCGVHTISLSLDSTVVFSKSYDRLSYNADENGNLDYLSGEEFGGTGQVSALFRRTGNRIGFYRGDGVLSSIPFAPGIRHTLTIEASDFAGNRTSRSFNVLFGERPRVGACRYTTDGVLTVEVDPQGGQATAAECWIPSGRSWRLQEVAPLTGVPAKTRFTLPPTVTRCRVVLTGPADTRSLPVTLGRPDPEANRSSTPLSITFIPRHDRLLVRIAANSPFPVQPAIRWKLNGIPGSSGDYPIQESDSVWVSALPLPSQGLADISLTIKTTDIHGRESTAEESVEYTILAPGKAGMARSTDGHLVLNQGAESLYRPLPVLITEERILSSQGLTPCSTGYLVAFGDEPLRSSLSVNFSFAGSIPDHAALFFSPGNPSGLQNWQFAALPGKDGRFTASVSRTGCFAVLADTLAPTVTPVLPKPGSTITERRPSITARIRDDGSGLAGSDAIRLTLDGTIHYGEYDYEAGMVRYQVRRDLAAGDHTVSVEVTDGVGNSTKRAWSFRVEH